ncbi:MAG: 50S ribosomal protein L18 [Candidatus Micrarchaeia archaeon]|jgi:large subunit ribosomal protein L18
MARATGPIYKLKFKRRRENLTNYAKRLALLKSGKTRLVVRSTNRQMIVHFVNTGPKGDVTVCGVTSAHLDKYGWKPKRNLPTAYLTGLLAGKLALKKGVKEAVLDAGLRTASKNSVLFGALKGAADSGVKVPHGEDLVDESRLKGSHIDAYAKAKGSATVLAQEFEKAKAAIAKGV